MRGCNPPSDNLYGKENTNLTKKKRPLSVSFSGLVGNGPWGNTKRGALARASLASCRPRKVSDDSEKTTAMQKAKRNCPAARISPNDRKSIPNLGMFVKPPSSHPFGQLRGALQKGHTKPQRVLFAASWLRVRIHLQSAGEGAELCRMFISKQHST